MRLFLYARLFLAACAQPLRYVYPYVVQAVRGTFTIVPPRLPPAFAYGPGSNARVHVVHAYVRVPPCIRRAYVRPRAKKRSCSIAGVSTFRPASNLFSTNPASLYQPADNAAKSNLDRSCTYYEGISSSSLFFFLFSLLLLLLLLFLFSPRLLSSGTR